MKKENRASRAYKKFLSKLERNKKEKQELKILKTWEKAIMRNTDKLLAQAKDSKEKAIEGILMLDAVYILEDVDGQTYTREVLQQKSHQDIYLLLERYVNELKGDYEFES